MRAASASRPRAGARRSAHAHDAALMYELIDAHADTIRLIDERADAAQWLRHRNYLRDLQRGARELLASADDSIDRVDDPRRSLPATTGTALLSYLTDRAGRAYGRDSYGSPARIDRNRDQA